MKVWELMSKLAELPAGAEVKVKHLLSEKEIEPFAVEDDLLEGKHFNIVGKVQDVVQDREGTAVLYC